MERYTDVTALAVSVFCCLCVACFVLFVLVFCVRVGVRLGLRSYAGPASSDVQPVDWFPRQSPADLNWSPSRGAQNSIWQQHIVFGVLRVTSFVFGSY